MNKILYSTALAGGLAFVGFVGSASASTVTISSEDFYTPSNVNAPIFGTAPPNVSTPKFTQNVSGSLSGDKRSPYELNNDGNSGTFYSILAEDGQVGSATATYNLGGANTFEILWGSPDIYNHISFYTGANGLGSLIDTSGASATDYIGSDTHCYSTTCQQLGWDDIVFSSTVAIGSVVLRDDVTAAFEYGLNPEGIIPSTPLPAAVWMFGTVIAGAAGAARLRRRKA